MPETFFISDLHLGHHNIVKFEPHARPFDCVADCDQAIIAAWRKTVAPTDTVYLLGDVVFPKTALPLVHELTGHIHVILGNHDDYYRLRDTKRFDSFHGCLYWGRHGIMTHFPVHPDTIEYRFTFNLHGHLHSRMVEVGVPLRYVNVSVETTVPGGPWWSGTPYAPINWSTIERALRDAGKLPAQK